MSQHRRKGRAPAEPAGADRLRAALHRFGRFLRAQPPERNTDDQEPAGNWQERTDERLLAIEKTLASQNRLLVLSVFSILAETIYRIVVK